MDEMNILVEEELEEQDIEVDDADEECSAQKFSSKTIIGQTNDRKHTCFYHCYCMKKCCNRSWSNPCLWKPLTHRPHSGFYAKSHKCK